MNPSIHTAQVLPARAVLFLGIAGFHALLAYAFASGLIATTVHILRPDNFEVIKLPDPTIPDDGPREPNTAPTLYKAKTTPLPDLPVISMEPDATTITLPPEPVASSGAAADPPRWPQRHAQHRGLLPAGRNP